MLWFYTEPFVTSMSYFQSFWYRPFQLLINNSVYILATC